MHGVIAMSGSAFEYWTLDNDPTNSLITHGKAFDPPCYKKGFTSDDIVDCIKGKSLKEIVMTATKVYVSKHKHLFH